MAKYQPYWVMIQNENKPLARIGSGLRRVMVRFMPKKKRALVYDPRTGARANITLALWNSLPQVAKEPGMSFDKVMEGIRASREEIKTRSNSNGPDIPAYRRKYSPSPVSV